MLARATKTVMMPKIPTGNIADRSNEPPEKRRIASGCGFCGKALADRAIAKAMRMAMAKATLGVVSTFASHREAEPCGPASWKEERRNSKNAATQRNTAAVTPKMASVVPELRRPGIRIE